MATYVERTELANDQVFLGRTRNAAIRYAMYLGPNDDGTDAWYLARSVLQNSEHWSRLFAQAVASEPETLEGGDNDPAAATDAGDVALTYAIEQRVWPAYSAGMAPPVLTPSA